MNLKEAIAKACECETLVEALTFIAIWETDRAVHQAIDFNNLYKTNYYGPAYETCFKVIFEELILAFENSQWEKKSKAVKDVLSNNSEVDGIFLDRRNNNYYVAVKEHRNIRSFRFNSFKLEDKFDTEISVRAHQGRNIADMFEGLEKIWLRSDV